MKVKVTKKMAKMLDTAAKDRNMSFDYREMKDNGDGYRFCIGDPWIAEEYGDYDYNRGVFKYIAVMYPDEYYALPNYLTTYDLNKLFMEVKHDGIVFDEFAKHVMNAMEV